MRQYLRRPLRRAVLTALVLVALRDVASAQAELDGSAIDYLGIGADGTMIGPGDHSMRYRESPADDYSCDLWAPDTPVSTFSVRATGAGLLGSFAGTNDGSGAPGISTTSPTQVSGRTIRWSGAIQAGLLGAGRLDVLHAWTFEPDDRVVVQTITLRNGGSVRLDAIYYVTHGDPDQGVCDVGASNDTRNDVLRQPPTDGSALVVASTIDAVTPRIVIGMGSYGADARADVSESIYDTDPVDAWIHPHDPNGAVDDRGMSIAFRVQTLAVGASVTFQVLYVWGSSVESVITRFEDATCGMRAEGASCSVGGATGTCHATGCCLGCWNGTSCAAGDSVGSCGKAGGACATCGDGSFCTSGDACNAGACTVGTTPTCADALACTTNGCDEAADRCTTQVTGGGCAVDGACVAAGSASPGDACLVCNPASSTTSWTAAAGCDGDGDGVPDSVERPNGVPRDTDGDGTPDHLDPDDDGDGIPTRDERPGFQDRDTDEDGIPDYLESDDDGDGVPTREERVDGSPIDTDHDGTPNERDADDDGDGLLTRDERSDEAALGGDVDADGTPAYLDLDSDGDGASDTTEGRLDRDDDGVLDYLDADTRPMDGDGDGVPDVDECPRAPCRDTDGDGTPDVSDGDDDGDGIPTSVELADETRYGGDVDGDGVPAYLDTDADGDGRSDRSEGTGDADGDGVPNYLDPTSDGPSGGNGGGIVGGALCEASPVHAAATPLAFFLALLALVVRRRGAR